MNFFRKIFPRTYNKISTSVTKENNNMTANRETSIDRCHSHVDNSFKQEPKSNNEELNNTNDELSVVVSSTDDGCIKIIHNLRNVTPIEIIPYDNDGNKQPREKEIRLDDNAESEDATIFNNIAEASPLNISVVGEPEINKMQVAYKADVSNGTTHNSDVEIFNIIDDETMKSYKELEEALNYCQETEFINIDDFNELFDELDDMNKAPISTNGSVETLSESHGKEQENNEIHSNIIENIEVISINSSTDDENAQIEEIKPNKADLNESDSDDGYNSSDFEFISEAEANMTGFIINYGLEDCQNLSPASSEPLIYYCGQHFEDDGEKEPFDPGEGPSRQDRPANEFEDRSYRNEHHIPVGDDYFGLFQGIYNPLLTMSDIYFLENKSVRASAMNSQYDGLGFDRQLALRRHQPDRSEDEFEDEAKESAKKILNMYPGQNRKRRRRH